MKDPPVSGNSNSKFTEGRRAELVSILQEALEVTSGLLDEYGDDEVDEDDTPEGNTCSSIPLGHSLYEEGRLWQPTPRFRFTLDKGVPKTKGSPPR